MVKLYFFINDFFNFQKILLLSFLLLIIIIISSSIIIIIIIISSNNNVIIILVMVVVVLASKNPQFYWKNLNSLLHRHKRQHTSSDECAVTQSFN